MTTGTTGTFLSRLKSRRSEVKGEMLDSGAVTIAFPSWPLTLSLTVSLAVCKPSG